MMYSCLEKELGPSLLVERLSERSCAVKNKPHEVNHTSFCGKCVELASNRVPCRQSADDGKNQNYKTASPRPKASRPLLSRHALAGERRESHERRQGSQYQLGSCAEKRTSEGLMLSCEAQTNGGGLLSSAARRISCGSKRASAASCARVVASSSAKTAACGNSCT